MLRFDDVKRLKREHLSFETNEKGDYIRVKLIGKRNKQHYHLG